MAKFGFLSHSDMSIYFFRAPIMRKLQELGHEVYAIAPKGKYTPNLEKDKNIALPNMLYNETNAVSDLKQIYGYYLNSVNNEFSRLEKILAFGHKHNLIDNAKKEITIISELFKNISDIAVSSPKYSIDNIVKEIKTENNNKEEEKK